MYGVGQMIASPFTSRNNVATNHDPNQTLSRYVTAFRD